MTAGRYLDGRSAAIHAVTVHADPSGLVIVDGQGNRLAFWPRTELRRVDGPGPELRLGCVTAPDARLTIADGATVAAMLPVTRTPSRWRGAALGAAALASVAGAWLALPGLSAVVAAAIPLETEARWGAGLADKLEREWGTCSGAGGEAALTALTDTLSAALPAELRPRRVAVVRVKEVNALALPGGRVLLFKGLLDQAKGPDEVAGVLAHEFAHVAERHAAQAMIRIMGVSALVTLVTGDYSGALAGGLTMALAGAYSRDDEAAADRGAVDLLDRAGIDTHGLAAFFRRLAADGGGLPDWLSSHPDPAARAHAVEQAGHRGRRPALTATQWAALRAICR